MRIKKESRSASPGKALGKPIVKNFDPPRSAWLSGAGGSPSASVDTTMSQISQQNVGQEPTYTGEGEDSEEAECGCNSMMRCRCPKKSIVLDEALLRVYIREAFVHELSVSDATKGISHFALDVCGIAADLTGVGAGVGAACDATNAIAYAVEGENLLAAFSLVSTIPAIGDVLGKGGKIANWLLKTFPKASKQATKHGPKVIQKIKMAKETLRRNESMINKLFDEIQEDPKLEKLHPFVPKMQSALNAFIGESFEEKSAMSQSNKQQEATSRRLQALIRETVIDEDEEEETDDDLDEFSGAGAVAGATLPLGAATPSFGRKRKKKGSETKGFKYTHG